MRRTKLLLAFAAAILVALLVLTTLSRDGHRDRTAADHTASTNVATTSYATARETPQLPPGPRPFLDPAHERGAIVGAVRFDDGTVPASLEMTLAAPLGDVTRDGAKFRIDGVPVGAHPLRILGADFLASRVIAASVRANEVTDVGEIIVQRGRVIAGIVVDDAGAPVPFATVVIGERVGCHPSAGIDAFGNDSGPRITQLGAGGTITAGADGRFRLAHQPYKRFAIVAEHRDHGRSRPIAIDAARTDRELRMQLEPTASIAGRVRGIPAGVAVRVRATPKDAPLASCTVEIAADGTFHVDELTAGRYVVSADASVGQGDRVALRERRTEVRVEIDREANVELDLSSSDGAELEIVVQPVGMPWGMARHALFRGPMFVGTQGDFEDALLGTREAWQTSGSQGRAVLAPIPPGTYTLCTVLFPPMFSTLMFEVVKDTALEMPVQCRAVEVAGGSQVITIDVAPGTAFPAPARSGV